MVTLGSSLPDWRDGAPGEKRSRGSLSGDGEGDTKMEAPVTPLGGGGGWPGSVLSSQTSSA